MTLTLFDEFAGAGGSTQGAASVPGVVPVFAANHNALAVASHARNFPAVDHFCGDVTAADITGFPRADLFWASPACPAWTDARGKRRDFDTSNQAVLFGPAGPDQATMRSRALMEEIPRYLAAMALRGKPGVSLECRPALDVIGDYGRHPAVLLYCDPPYLGTTRGPGKQYRHELRDDAGHRDLAAALHACSAAVVLSGYPSALYDELYAGWHTTRTNTSTGNGGTTRGRVEVLWSNRPMPVAQPDLFGTTG